MTFQSYYLLRRLKKVQAAPDNLVYIDLDAMTACTVREVREPYNEVSLKQFRPSLDSTLQYLKGLGYVQYENIEYVSVTHTGWHIAQTLLSNLCAFLISSIAVPILVSIATTLITLWISQLFR